MELIAIYLGFLAFSFVGAHQVTLYMGDSTAYILAGAALAAQIAGGIAGLGYEKKWGKVTGIAGLTLSALLIAAGASVLVGKPWPLVATVGALGSGLVFWLAVRYSDRRQERGGRPFSNRVLGTLAFIPLMAIIAVSIAVGLATGWF